MNGYQLVIEGPHGSRTYKNIERDKGISIQLSAPCGALSVNMFYDPVSNRDHFRVVQLNKLDGVLQSVVGEGVINITPDAIDALSVADRAKLAEIVSDFGVDNVGYID